MMAATSVALVMGGSLTACVDLDLSPNNAPSEGNVWNSASMAEQTIAGVYNRLYEDYTADPNKGWFDMWSSIMDIDANWTCRMSAYMLPVKTCSPSPSSRAWTLR